MAAIDQDIVADMLRWRHEIHANPEVAFREVMTSGLVADELIKLGLQVERGLGETGLVATLTTGHGPVVGLRAEMDALELTEANQLSYKSLRPGVMHACGHDGHTCMLLGAAKQLARSRQFSGVVRFIFQPAEENEGGAKRMLDDGLFERFPCDAIYAIHNWPNLPLGQMSVNRGPMMASFDIFEFQIRGRGTHAAMPEKGCDPFLVLGHLLLGLQAIPSRRLSPHDAAVVSVTQVHGGDTWNVIPEEVLVRGTVRCLSEGVRDTIEASIKQLAGGLGGAHQAEVVITYERRYPATVNASSAAEFAASVAASGGLPVQIDCSPSMASEDFSFLLQQVPGAYLWMGAADDAHREPLHSPLYDFNDRLLEIGASYWVDLIEKALPRRDAIPPSERPQ